MNQIQDDEPYRITYRPDKASVGYLNKSNSIFVLIAVFVILITLLSYAM